MKDDKKKLGKLLKIFKTGTDVEKVLFDGEDPYMLYHLSSMRTNLLSWYEFDPAGSVLEVGAECGVITEFLCGRTASVTAVEADEDKCAVIRERTSAHGNVQVICGGIKDVPSGSKFDYITLIGVHVDADLLSKARGLLNPGGTVFFAVDNRFGLAGWSDPSVFTDTENKMSYDGFKKLIGGVGFKSCSIFYPYPDYVFPLQIFTDSRLPKADELMTSAPTYEGEKLYFFDENKVAADMVREGVYPSFANSYLAVLSDSADAAYPVYVKYNTTRRPDLRIDTALYAEDGKLIKAVKSASEPSAVPMIGTIESNYARLKSEYRSIRPVGCKNIGGRLEFPFVEGTTLLSDLDLKSGSKEDILKAISDAFDKIFDYADEAKDFAITPEFTKMFPGCCPGPEDKALSTVNIDSNFDNFIVTDDGIVCIDYEWVADFPVPVNYVKFRALLYYYTKNQAYLRDKIDINELYDAFGFKDREGLYACMEDCFQQYVHGEYRRYIYTDRYRVQPMSLEQKDKIAADRWKMLADEKDCQIKSLKEKVEARDELLQDISRVVRDPKFAMHKMHVRRERRKRYKAVYDLNSGLLDFYKSRHGEYLTAIGNHMVPYEDWIEYVESLDSHGETFEYNPKISVIVPVYNCPDKFLIPCIESVLDQTYMNIELCLSDDNSPDEHVRETMRKYENDPRVKCVYRKENGHISLNSNSAIEVADGEFIAFLDCDDTLSPNAIYEVVKAINEAKKKGIDLDFIYSDEDKIDDEGKNRHMPHFKPDWSPDTMMSIMYTCHLGVYRKTLGDKTGWLREGFEGSQDYDFVLRLTELTTPEKICHIPKILYHWREHAGSTALNVGSKPYFLEASRRAKVEALKRRGYRGRVELVGLTFQWRIVYDSVTLPLVSIIIPSKDNYDYLNRCISSLVKNTMYRNFEIIVVDNGSSEENKIKYSELVASAGGKYIYEPMQFNFSRMCNKGAEAAEGQYLLFLNDDIEIRDGIWLQRMVGHAELPYIGAVGAKLMYPENGLIQHCGVTNLREAGPVHSFIGKSDAELMYFLRNKIEYDWIAVTAACLLVNKEKFDGVGGFNEEFAVAFNDVDLCFKLYEAGYYNVVREDAVLVHYESVSRGYDNHDDAKMERLISERDRLYSMHPDLRGRDPFYNPNLTGRLADYTCDNLLTEPEDE